MSYQAAVITVSDRASAGVYEDKSGPAVAAMLKEAGYEVVYTSIVPDEQEKISEELISCVDEKHCDLVITSGGTGLSPRDVTPEATCAVLEREIPATAGDDLLQLADHAARDAFPRRGRHEKKQPHPEPPRLGKGCTRKPERRARRA